MPNTTWSTTDKSVGVTLSGGNLIATTNSGGTGGRTTDRNISGKFYWEVTCNTFSSANSATGICNLVAVNGVIGATPTNACVVYRSGAIWLNNANTTLTLGAIANGNIVCIALDLDNQRIWFRVGAAGNWNGGAGNNPATNVGGVNTVPVAGAFASYPCYSFGAASEQFTANFGDTAFTGAVPAGFTSGFTAGASIPTNALATQLAAEQWFTTNPDARVTQVALEHWGSAASGNLQLLATQIALEHWASVADEAGGTQSRAMILA